MAEKDNLNPHNGSLEQRYVHDLAKIKSRGNRLMAYGEQLSFRKTYYSKMISQTTDPDKQQEYRQKANKAKRQFDHVNKIMARIKARIAELRRKLVQLQEREKDQEDQKRREAQNNDDPSKGNPYVNRSSHKSKKAPDDAAKRAKAKHLGYELGHNHDYDRKHFKSPESYGKYVRYNRDRYNIPRMQGKRLDYQHAVPKDLTPKQRAKMKSRWDQLKAAGFTPSRHQAQAGARPNNNNPYMSKDPRRGKQASKGSGKVNQKQPAYSRDYRMSHFGPSKHASVNRAFNWTRRGSVWLHRHYGNLKADRYHARKNKYDARASNARQNMLQDNQQQFSGHTFAGRMAHRSARDAQKAASHSQNKFMTAVAEGRAHLSESVASDKKFQTINNLTNPGNYMAMGARNAFHTHNILKNHRKSRRMARKAKPYDQAKTFRAKLMDRQRRRYADQLLKNRKAALADRNKAKQKAATADGPSK